MAVPADLNIVWKPALASVFLSGVNTVGLCHGVEGGWWQIGEVLGAKDFRALARLEEEISQRLGTTVQIRPGRKGSGTILVRYSGLDHLDQLLKKLR